MNEHAPLYQHAMRAEWGYGAVAEVHDDRTTFKFADGTSRSIRHSHLHLMQVVELEEAEASEVRKRIGKLASLRPPLPVEPTPKRKSSAKKAAKPK